jgi:hypothetical protein
LRVNFMARYGIFLDIFDYSLTHIRFVLNLKY